jgi:glycyl-tRNA synthetase beta chain
VVDGYDPDEVGAAVFAFFISRFEGILRDRGFDAETVAAVLQAAGHRPADALARCEALSSAREGASEAFEDLSIAFKRAANLAGDAGLEVDRTIMGAHELALAEALDEAARRVDELFAQGAYGAVLEVYAGMRGPIDDFFENVLVMDEDRALRANRLGLLARFVALFSRFADFSRLAS